MNKILEKIWAWLTSPSEPGSNTSILGGGKVPIGKSRKGIDTVLQRTEERIDETRGSKSNW